MEEVHRWRGTAHQRNGRSLTGKSGRFAYFDQQLDYPDWTGKAVLDFGGNEGNLLLDQNCPIKPENYYCIDVISEALAEGRKRFPEAHWIHYNRYNCSFNPEGIDDLPIPDLGRTFDWILAYSVFTHTTRDEMHDLVDQLRARLTPEGTLAFTFIDPHFNPWPETYKGTSLRWRLERVREANPGINIDELLAQGRDAHWCALVDGARLFVNGNGVWDHRTSVCMTYNVYYTAECLQREFPGAVIRQPVNNEMQHCCLIRQAA